MVISYLYNTEKELEKKLEGENKTEIQKKYYIGSACELVGAYILSAHPLVATFLALDGLTRIIRQSIKHTPQPGIVGYVREIRQGLEEYDKKNSKQPK
ncbi:hypothetical protein KY312_01285 [Candidatus Woesearchaeota archaeon]|nr:hypothetical protein [Candidatus Woesearchaeota archaeon]